MNRFMLILLILLSASFVYAEDEYVAYKTFDNDGFRMRYVPKDSETNAWYDVTVDSISIWVVKTSTYSMGFQLNRADMATFKLFRDSMTATANQDTGGGPRYGKWEVDIPEDVSPYNYMTGLDTVVVSSTCLSSWRQLAIDSSSNTIVSFSPKVRAGKSVKIKYAIANITGTSPAIQGFDQANTALTPSASMTSAASIYFGVEDTNHPIFMAPEGETCEVRCTATGITAGWLLIGYTRE